MKSFASIANMVTVALICAATMLNFLSDTANAAEKSHGLSAFGDLKYPAGFKHFDYVNPEAPKGGTLSMIGTAGLVTFNSLNQYIIKGDAAQGMEYTFDSLMVRAWDEPDAVYGLLAQSALLADDKKSVTFYLRPEAKFADGTPVTADDVVYSLDILKEEGDPQYRLAMKDVQKAEALGPNTVRYTFEGDQVRDLPLIVATLPVFSKAYYETHDFNKTTLEPPLGSGPYKVGKLKQGTFITYELRDDYWAKDLPVNVGRFNFDTLRYEYYKDRVAEFEALKSGQFDLREEFYSKMWATAYDIDQVKKGYILRHTIPDERAAGAQGFFFNTRKEKFKDPKVREAIALAFDFEWSNKNLFYNLYTRTNSFFENSTLMAMGVPSPQELALLEPYRDKLPPQVFKEAYTAPVSDGSGQDRKLLREASKLLRDAGWNVEGGKRVNAKGEVLDIEFLLFSPSFERVVAPYVKNLKLLGIDATIRRVDPAQFQERTKTFDFDMVVRRYAIPNTPGVILRNYWGSSSANAKGSQNLAGVNDPVIDALIEKVIKANSRAELMIAARALDRVFRAKHYWVPHWYKGAHNIAFWNKFSWPATKPKYDRGVIETWWYDAQKAATLPANK